MEPIRDEFIPASPDPGLMGGLMDALKTGISHSYGQVRDDLSSLMGGQLNPGTIGRMWDVAGELPIGKVAGAFGRTARGAFDALGQGDMAKGIWGPIRSPEQKKAVSALWRVDPGAVKAIDTDPRTLFLNIPGRNLEAARHASGTHFFPVDSMGSYQGRRLNVQPASMRGRVYDTKLDKFVPHPDANLPEIMQHEANHFLNRVRLGAPEEQSMQMFEKLSPYLGSHARVSSVLAGLEAGPGAALDEALSYLSVPSSRDFSQRFAGQRLHDLIKMKPGPGRGQGTLGVQLTPENIERAIQLTKTPTSLFGDIVKEGGDKLRKMRLGPKLTAAEQIEYDKIPRPNRTFQTPPDVEKLRRGEKLPPLGTNMPNIPRPVSSPGALEFFNELKRKLGLP